MSLHLLTVGEHPNLAFYAWRLLTTRQCLVTMVSDSLDPANPLRFLSTLLKPGRFQPQEIHESLESLSPKRKYDVVLLSVPNLQSFQDTCTSLAPYLHSESLIVVESTGYVALETFVVSSFPKTRQVTVCSIMNESDVKRWPKRNDFLHSVLDQDQRIYLGTCTDELKALYKVSDSATYASFYKLLQTVQEQLIGHISLLKLNNYKEFMTYQWKLALPRIVLNPLSVIFEEPFPANLHKQILAKPLISGLVNEIFKIIKKMDCKLIKGYENEGNILKNWLTHYPATDSDVEPKFANTNLVFYNFDHQIDVDVDLLLLQPILLGDDHGVRTPYLENLYSIVCQLLKMNFSESIFFIRKNGQLAGSSSKELNGLLLDLAKLKLEKEEMESQYKERQDTIQQLEATLLKRQQAQDTLVRKYEEQTRLFDIKLGELSNLQSQKESSLAELNSHLHQKQTALQNLESRIMQAEAAWSQQEQRYNHRSEGQGDGKLRAFNGVDESETMPKESHAQQSNDNDNSGHGSQSKTYGLLQMQTPDLSELAHVVAYGASLNGDASSHEVPPPPHNSVGQSGGAAPGSGDLSEKEKELQRREQALLEREREIKKMLLLGQMGTQNDPYYDTQTGEHYYDVAPNHAQQPGKTGMYNGSGGHNNGQNYRSSYSLSGGNPYNQQLPPQPQAQPKAQSQVPYDATGYDQRPPHGLPPNGFPQNSLPPTLRNPQRYQQHGPQYNQQPSHIPQHIPPHMQQHMPQQGPMQQQRPRIYSHNSGPAAINYPNQMPPQQYPAQQNMPPQTYQSRSNSMAFQQQPMQNLASQQHQLNQGAYGSGQTFAGKKSNRRSAFPDQALNIDYGGRGGMPMPTANGNKHKSMIMGGAGAQSTLLLNQQKKVSSGANPGAQVQQQTYLRVPNQMPSSNSESLTSHGSMGDDSSKHTTPESLRDFRMEVPKNEPTGKPLGGIAPPAEEKKKKKRSFLKH